jgi:nitrite reductase/ring-hydroxylating ferredoxin subunit
MTITRREFMQLAGATVLCACAGTAGISGCSHSTGVSNVPLAPEGSYRRDGGQVVVALGATDALDPVGGAVRLALDDGDDAEVKIIVVHSEHTVYQAFANECSHNGKELDYLHAGEMLQCCSGKAQFDLDGNVFRGPAERALRVYPARREGDELIIEVPG